MKYLLIVFLLCVFLCNCKVFAKDMLLSFNKCGSHYTLFALQYLTERPFLSENDAEMSFKTGLNICEEKQPIYHSHVPNFNNNYYDTKRVIVLVRNPLEILLRSYNIDEVNQLLNILAFNYPFDPNEEIGYPSGRFLKKVSIDYAIKSIKHLVSLYSIYHNLEDTNKIIIYYEDLIRFPEKTFREMLNFFNEKENKLDEFLINIEELQSQCQASYVEQFIGCQATEIVRSDGKTIDYYQSQYEPGEVLKIIDLIKRVFDKELHPYLRLEPNDF